MNLGVGQPASLPYGGVEPQRWYSYHSMQFSSPLPQSPFSSVCYHSPPPGNYPPPNHNPPPQYPSTLPRPPDISNLERPPAADQPWFSNQYQSVQYSSPLPPQQWCGPPTATNSYPRRLSFDEMQGASFDPWKPPTWAAMRDGYLYQPQQPSSPPPSSYPVAQQHHHHVHQGAWYSNPPSCCQPPPSQPSPHPPQQHSQSAMVVNGHLLPHQFPCASQTHAQFSPAPNHSPHPNPNLWVHSPISQDHTYEPSITSVHSQCIPTKTMTAQPIYDSAPSVFEQLPRLSSDLEEVESTLQLRSISRERGWACDLKAPSVDFDDSSCVPERMVKFEESGKLVSAQQPGSGELLHKEPTDAKMCELRESLKRSTDAFISEFKEELRLLMCSWQSPTRRVDNPQNSAYMLPSESKLAVTEDSTPLIPADNGNNCKPHVDSCLNVHCVVGCVLDTDKKEYDEIVVNNGKGKVCIELEHGSVKQIQELNSVKRREGHAIHLFDESPNSNVLCLASCGKGSTPFQGFSKGKAPPSCLFRTVSFKKKGQSKSFVMRIRDKGGGLATNPEIDDGTHGSVKCDYKPSLTSKDLGSEEEVMETVLVPNEVLTYAYGILEFGDGRLDDYIDKEVAAVMSIRDKGGGLAHMPVEFVAEFTHEEGYPIGYVESERSLGLKVNDEKSISGVVISRSKYEANFVVDRLYKCIGKDDQVYERPKSEDVQGYKVDLLENEHSIGSQAYRDAITIFIPSALVCDSKGRIIIARTSIHDKGGGSATHGSKDSDEEVITDEEWGGKKLLNSPTWASLAKAATSRASTDGNSLTLPNLPTLLYSSGFTDFGMSISRDKSKVVTEGYSGNLNTAWGKRFLVIVSNTFATRLKHYTEGSKKIRHYALLFCFYGFDKKVRDKGSGHPLRVDGRFVLDKKFTGNMRLLWDTHVHSVLRIKVIFVMDRSTDIVHTMVNKHYGNEGEDHDNWMVSHFVGQENDLLILFEYGTDLVNSCFPWTSFLHVPTNSCSHSKIAEVWMVAFYVHQRRSWDESKSNLCIVHKYNDFFVQTSFEPQLFRFAFLTCRYENALSTSQSDIRKNAVVVSLLLLKWYVCLQRLSTIVLCFLALTWRRVQGYQIILRTAELKLCFLYVSVVQSRSTGGSVFIIATLLSGMPLIEHQLAWLHIWLDGSITLILTFAKDNSNLRRFVVATLPVNEVEKEENFMAVSASSLEKDCTAYMRNADVKYSCKKFGQSDDQFTVFMSSSLDKCDGFGLLYICLQEVTMLLAMILKALKPDQFYVSDADYTAERVSLLSQLHHSLLGDTCYGLKEVGWYKAIVTVLMMNIFELMKKLQILKVKLEDKFLLRGMDCYDLSVIQSCVMHVTRK